MGSDISLSQRERVILDCALDLEQVGYLEAAEFLRAKVWVLRDMAASKTLPSVPRKWWQRVVKGRPLKVETSATDYCDPVASKPSCGGSDYPVFQ